MFLKKLFGTSSTRYIKKISPEIKKINDFYDGLSSKSDQDLVDRTNELKKINRRINGRELSKIETKEYPQILKVFNK